MPTTIPAKRGAATIGVLVLAITSLTSAQAALVDGDIDPAFGIAGQTLALRDSPDDRNSAPLFQVASLPGGAVQAAFRHHADGSVVVLRVGTQGLPDAAFGTEGRVEIDTCRGSGDVSIATPNDGGAVVFTGACLVKLDASGALDPAFGDQGTVALEAGPNFMAMDAGGRIVVAGLDAAGLLAHRYRADGSNDSSFGDGGSARLDFSIPSNPGGTPSGRQLYALVLDLTGGMTAGGRYYGPDPDEQSILLLRMRSDGTPEQAFGVGGVVRYSTSALASNASVDALLPLADGSVVVAGPADCFGDCMLFGRFDPQGQADAAFGLLLNIPGNPLRFLSFFEHRSAIAALADGRILVAIEAWPLGNSLATRGDLTLLRFLPGGTLDVGFGESGWRSYTTEDPCATCGLVHPSASYDNFHGFVVADGKVTLLGRVFFEDSTNAADYITLTRVQMDGVFGNGFD